MRCVPARRRARAPTHRLLRSLSVARAAAGSKPLVPAFAASALRSADAAGVSEAALQALSEQSGSSQRELLQRLLASKQAELAKANAEAAQYSALLAQRSAAPAAEASSGESDTRVRELEALLEAELQKKLEQTVLNEELLKMNEEQVAANKLLVNQLLAAAPSPAVQWTDTGRQ